MYHRLLLPFTALGTVMVLTLAASTPIPVHAEIIEAWGEAGEASPFEFEILHAELTEDGNGEPKLKLGYRIHNVSEELIAAVAWSLDVRDEGGKTVAGASGSFEVTLKPGETVDRSSSFGSSLAKLVSPTGSVTLTAAGGSFSYQGRCAGSAQSEEEACSNWNFACESLCGANNPLVVGPGVHREQCGSCVWMQDQETGCDYLSCQAICVCNSWELASPMPAGPGPWEMDPSGLPPGPCAEPIHPDEGFFYFGN